MRRRWRWLQLAGGLALVVGALLMAAREVVTMFEHRFIFFPETNFVALPEHFDMGYEEVLLETADGNLVHGWYCTPPRGGAPRAFLLFSHGNAGNISGRLPLVEELVHRQLAVLLYDYRGYGRSPGHPSEEGLYTDAEAALDELLERAGDPRHVVLYGRSLGGAVSWELAVRHPELAGIISDCAFTSIPDMAVRLFTLPLVGKIVRTKMDNRRKVSEVTMPKLILHGTEDEVIPYWMGEELRDRASEPLEFVSLPGAHHNDTYLVDPELYFGTLDRFIDGVIDDR